MEPPSNKQRNSERAVVCEYFVASLSMFYIKLILFFPIFVYHHRHTEMQIRMLAKNFKIYLFIREHGRAE